LVNNAGIYRFGPIEAFSESDFHDQFNANVLSVFLATREALKHFGPEGGSIINIATAAVSVNGPYTSVYTATKSAIVAITRVLAKELGARKIRVNAIAPGGTDIAPVAVFLASDESGWVTGDTIFASGGLK
jgi:3-oxoacyl-[acyl-carrier protein] reductase